MSSINCEINLFLTWLANCFIMTGTIDNQEPTIIITDTTLYVPFVTSPVQDNV